jgi:hypothetical protein
VLTLVACSGSERSPGEAVEPAAYVRQVCQAVARWDEDVGSAYRASEERPDDDRSSVLRRDILDFFDDVQDGTDTMVERVEEAGTPDVAQGEGIARELRDAVSGASQRLRANRDSFAAIPISDVQPAASIEGAMTVFAEQIEAVDAAVDRLGERSPVLRRQREREPACDRMTREE